MPSSNKTRKHKGGFFSNRKYQTPVSRKCSSKKCKDIRRKRHRSHKHRGGGCGCGMAHGPIVSFSTDLNGGSKTMSGGSLDTPVFSLPINKFYPLSDYQHDPNSPHTMQSSRLLGGKKRTVKGGSAAPTQLTDPFYGKNTDMTVPASFGSSAGSLNLASSVVGHSGRTDFSSNYQYYV